jgi:hypothetical protein
MAQENPSTAPRDERTSDTIEQDTPPAADTARPTTTDETNGRTYIRVQSTDTSLAPARPRASTNGPCSVWPGRTAVAVRFGAFTVSR